MFLNNKFDNRKGRKYVQNFHRWELFQAFTEPRWVNLLR